MDAIKDALSSRLAENAQYEQQQDKTECDEVTRDDVLALIDQWVRTPSDTEHCGWITGKPAVGKSAIGITVAQCLKDRHPIQAMRGDRRDMESKDSSETEFPFHLRTRFPRHLWTEENGGSGSASKWLLFLVSLAKTRNSSSTICIF